MSSDWFWECDANYQITSVDGSQNIDSLRAGLGDLLSPDKGDDSVYEKEALDELRSRLMKYQTIRNLEFKTPSKPSFWLSVSADPLFGEEGEFLGYYGTAQNIKGRKQAEQKLQERELILKKAQEVASIGSFYRNPETGESRWSDQMFRNFGMKPSDVSPSFIETGELLHPEDRERILKANRELTEDIREVHHQYRVIWPDGQERTLFASIVVERDVDGRLRHLGTVQDVTERLAVESALRDSEAMLQAIQENLPAALNIKEKDGRFTHVNKQFRMRYQQEEVDADVIGLTAFDLFDEDIARKFQEHDNRLLHEGVVSSEEVEMAWPDGRPLYVNNIKFPVVVGDKQFIGTISPDITEQKQAFLDLQRSEKLLQESENYLRELIQTANAPIISLDRNLQITDWNKAAENITGYTRDEVLGVGFVDRLITGDMQDQVRVMLNDDLTNVHTSNAKISLRTSAGKTATVLFSTTARRGEDDQIAGIICIGQDVTQLIQAQDQLSQSQKMEAVGQLTGGIAHDFNNLLQIISGATTMLEELQSGDGKLAKWITQIDEAVERGGSLTSQLLSFSRQQNLSPTVVRPGAVVSEIEALLQRTLGEDIHWNILVSGVTPPVFVDDHGLQNAIINLCVNSRAAMRYGGVLTIKVEEVEITEDEVVDDDVVEAGSFVEISVSDNGEGMTPETVENAINPFFSTKSVGEGTGLGLSMVYGFSRQSGGLTRITSEVGIGTRVSIFLPVTMQPIEEEDLPEMIVVEKQEPTVSQEPIVISGPILVVEDNEDVRDTTCAMLQIFGYDFVEAENANNALKILAQRPDINTIFSDVVMPGGMSGFDLAKKLEESGKKYNVLLTSGYPDKLSQGNSIVDHSIQMIAKPFTIEELETALGNLVEGVQNSVSLA
jgi:PAS domain S-box-containing protein